MRGLRQTFGETPDLGTNHLAIVRLIRLLLIPVSRVRQRPFPVPNNRREKRKIHPRSIASKHGGELLNLRESILDVECRVIGAS